MIGIALGASDSTDAMGTPNPPSMVAAPVFAGSTLTGAGQVATPVPTAPVFDDAILTEE